jgi:quinol monooxygenase YgiN
MRAGSPRSGVIRTTTEFRLPRGNFWQMPPGFLYSDTNDVGSAVELEIFARAHAREGKEAEVERAIRTVLPETRKEPECLFVRAYRSLTDPRLFYVHSRWRDRESFERHVKLPHTMRFDETITPLVDHDFTAQRMEEIA